MPGVSSPNSQEIQSFCPSEHSRYMRERNFDVIPSNTLTLFIKFSKEQDFSIILNDLENPILILISISNAPISFIFISTLFILFLINNIILFQQLLFS